MTKQPLKLADVEVKFINNGLRDLFGIDTITGLPIFRISWVDEQFEIRLSKFTPSGVELLTPEMMNLPKYNNYPAHTYMLERLVIVPMINEHEMTEKLSYEPLWDFELGQYPTIQACKFIIDTVLSAQAVNKMMIDPNVHIDRPLAKYNDHPDGKSTEEYTEIKKKRVEELHNQLFGDESGLMGATHNESSSAIIVPHNYKDKN
jgi:hypothetical protein